MLQTLSICTDHFKFSSFPCSSHLATNFLLISYFSARLNLLEKNGVGWHESEAETREEIKIHFKLSLVSGSLKDWGYWLRGDCNIALDSHGPQLKEVYDLEE